MSEWRYKDGVLLNPEEVGEQPTKEKPWSNEPNQSTWTDTATGLRCVVFRDRTWGHWHGCVELEPDHPLFGTNFDETLSFERRLTCYAYPKASPIRRENYWRVMFECMGDGDLAPWVTMRSYRKLVYRDMKYTKAKTEELAAKLHELSQ